MRRRSCLYGASFLGILVLNLERSLDDLLNLVDPGFFEEVGGLRDRTSLNLVELVYFHSLGDVRVEDVLGSYLIALLADLLLSSDDFILDLECLATELGELLGEIVRRNRDHTVHRSRPFKWFIRKVELTRDQISTLGFQMLIEDDLIHSLGKVNIDLVEEGSRV